jgi:15-cis-phytoene desaturase
LGGGVAGMTAAHELMERGFEVTVYESKSVPGGKARSIPVPGTGTEGRKDLPGEHGFRFFPSFYKHIPDTMSRIPYAGQRHGVLDNLVPASRLLMSRENAPGVLLSGRFPTNLDDLVTIFKSIFDTNLGIPEHEMIYFASRVRVFLSACEERRMQQFEHLTWWDFVGAETRSRAYQKYLAIGLTRSLVAMRPREASTRTVGTIGVQLLLGFVDPDPRTKPDRLLNGPTSEVWFEPWLAYLRAQGVVYHTDSKLERLVCENGRISHAVVSQGGASFEVEADFYVSAVPAEVMVRFVTPELAQADPDLARIAALRTEWMNGIQFFLREPIPIAHGHVIYADSPWALTSISQSQFWSGRTLSAEYGRGDVREILSVDVSDWNTPGVLFGKPARECSLEEIQQEVWVQLQRHLNPADSPALLRDEMLVTSFLDPGIWFTGPGKAENREPLLINTCGSWANRPNAVTRIPNLFLAADYVRTHTDLATMEAANEAARRAVNGILDACGSSKPACGIWALEEPALFWAAKQVDRIRFRLTPARLPESVS